MVDDDLRQTLWRLPGEDAPAAVAALADQPLYLIDGHHRAAAASTDRRAHRSPDHRMLSVLFPFHQLRNQAFHRVLTGVDAGSLLDGLGRRFDLRPASSVAEVVDRPEGWTAMAVGGPSVRWWLVELPPPAPLDWSVVDIDPIRLGQHVLAPLLGIQEPTPRPPVVLPTRPGRRPRPRRSSGLADGQIEFWMRPVPLTTLLDMVDRGQVMPPKSTYFEPKVRSGLFVRLTDPALTNG